MEKARYDLGLKLYDAANMILGGTVVFQFASDEKNLHLYLFGLVLFFAIYYAAYNVCNNND